MKQKTFSPNELKALWYHYGDARTAAKKIGIGTGTLIENATIDVRGRERKMSESVRERIAKTYNRLSPKTKRQISKLAKNLDKYPQEQVQKMILKTSPEKRKKLFEKFDDRVLKLKSKDGGQAYVVLGAYQRGLKLRTK